MSLLLTLLLAQADSTPQEPSVQATVRENAGQIKWCYEAQLKSDPELGGRIEVEFTLNKGRVAAAKVHSNTTGNEMLGKCIVGKLRRWRFPKELEGTVIYPFVLTPVGAEAPAQVDRSAEDAGAESAPVPSFEVQLRPSIASYSGQLTYCYEAQLKPDDELAGRLEIALIVKEGVVTSSSVQSNTTGDAALAECVDKKVRRWRFPSELTGEAVIPFVFEPGVPVSVEEPER